MLVREGTPSRKRTHSFGVPRSKVVEPTPLCPGHTLVPLIASRTWSDNGSKCNAPVELHGQLLSDQTQG